MSPNGYSLSFDIPRPLNVTARKDTFATSRCLHQEGYDATTIRKIASLLDCAVGSIYRYFHDKNQILSIVTQHGRSSPVVTCLETGGTLHQSIRQYHQIVVETPRRFIA